MKRLINISLIMVCAFFLAITGASAQEEAGPETASDILKFSTQQPSGSTRIQSIGGAQTALGGDISNASGNPAGLGFFNKSEFSITPTFNGYGSNTGYLGSKTTDFYGNLNINNLGVVFSRAKDAIVPGKWRGGSFAITFNTFNNFNNRFKFSGLNSNNSLSNYYAEVANGRNIHYEDLQDEQNDFGEFNSWEALAFHTYLIDVNADEDPAKYLIFIDDEAVRQTQTLTTQGSQSQWSFAYGGNYNDKLYFGATLGLTSFRYSESREYRETVTTQNDDFDDLNNFVLNHDITSRGSGINFTGGLIYRANDLIRLGASVQTPTYYYSVKTVDDGNITAIYNNFEYNPGDFLNTETGRLSTYENTYKFRTPWKLSGGVALFLSKNGFISADIDYVAYDKLKAFPSDNALVFNEVNDIVARDYKPAVNLRVGGEYRVSMFRFRAGYANYGSPIDSKDTSSINPKATQYVSVGAGIRLSNFYLDLGVVNTFSRTFNYYPYLLNDFSEPVAEVKNTSTKGMITLGFHF